MRSTMTGLLAVLIAIPLTLHPSAAAAIGGPGNIVMAVNHSDGRLAIRSNVQLVREPGMIAAPQNFAFASASCADCQTVAVALQLNFASTDARYIAPQNVAVASNEGCTRCTTIALAYQVFFTVEDATATPDGVNQVMRDLDAELRAVSTDPTMTVGEAETRIVSVIQRFMAYAPSFDQQRSASE
jgi:putative peptide zinc metalloprotease protein